MNNIKCTYHEPNPIMSECGVLYIWAHHLVSHEASLAKQNQCIRKLMEKLDNLISATGFEKCPINEGRWEYLSWKVYLAGNVWAEGKYNPRIMNTQQVFDTAKKIIEQYRDELERDK